MTEMIAYCFLAFLRGGDADPQIADVILDAIAMGSLGLQMTLHAMDAFIQIAIECGEPFALSEQIARLRFDFADFGGDFLQFGAKAAGGIF